MVMRAGHYLSCVCIILCPCVPYVETSFLWRLSVCVPMFQPARICMPVPLYHCFGMVLGSLQTVVSGATCVYPSEGFNAEACLEAVQQERWVLRLYDRGRWFLRV